MWLISSGGLALWYYFHQEKQKALVEDQRFTQAVSTLLLEDDLRKIVNVIGERNPSSTTAAANLSRTASMIEGLLGPSNSGYIVQKTAGPKNWPILQVSLAGRNPQDPAVWVTTSYDSRPRSRGAEANATGLAATLAAAQALAGDKPKRPIHFIFLPHANDPDSPVAETAAKLVELAQSSKNPTTILCVEAMGSGESLWINSNAASATPLNHLQGLGTAYGTEAAQASDNGLSTRLFNMNLPAVRVATRGPLKPDENDDHLPFAPTVAAASGRLIELIRRCSAN
ncbi:MAG: M28 family peptidase [Akkermansiaceae bacterium]|nr:M28 family peptidase [Akkermansiaceae bacterium]